MKRTPLLVIGAVAGLTGVLGLHSGAPAPGARSPQTAAPPPTGSPGTALGPTSAPRTTGSATGTAEGYGYGILAVRVTADAGRITNVALTELRTADPYSTSIADQVVPMLRNEVLAAQSAQINGVSGATYTAEAYAASVQSALDQLHLP